MTPYAPCTVDKVIEETVRVRKAGASVVHLHAKNPETKGLALDPNPILKKYIEGIKGERGFRHNN